MAETKSESIQEVYSPAERISKANDIVRKRIYWSLGIGLVPIPLVDFAALLGVQMEMVAKLAKLYQQEFRKDLAKKIIIALVGTSIPTLMARPLASLLKTIPIIGYTTGAVSMSALGGAGTYAVGKLFTKHFETGGTLFNFDPDKMKEEFTKNFEEGKTVVNGMNENA